MQYTYPTEFLNNLSVSGLPVYMLALKVGALIILTKNLKPPQLCNGIWLKVISLRKHIIQATIFTGCDEKDTVFTPRIPIASNNFPFQFK